MSAAIDRPVADACEVTLVDADRVEAARGKLPTALEIDRLADWFRLLGDPTRARILYALLEAGELCVCDISATIDVVESTVSHSLRWLRAERRFCRSPPVSA